MIHLRELQRDDIATINCWRQDRELLEGLAAPFRHIGPEVDQAWFDAYLANRDRQVRCAICEDGGTFVGVVSLTQVDPVHRNAEFHIMIGTPSARGRGAGTMATRQMLRHGFGDLNLHRIFLSVLESNAVAIRMYEKVGFTTEGRLRQAAFKDGAYCDLLMMGILQSEFRETPAGEPLR